MYIGIDVAKDELVVCVLNAPDESDETTVPNTKSGINKLHRWLKKAGAKTGHVCLEATGVYSDAVAEELHKRGYTVSVVNPARIKAYAQSQMRRNKTDALDAALIADYCRTQAPPAWEPPPPEVKQLRLYARHLDDLKTERQRARNRRDTQSEAALVKQLQAQIALLDKQIKQTEDLIRDHVNKHPDLKQQRDLLASIPGIGHLTAVILLAELGDIQRFDNVREVVAFVGLNPRVHQSGKKRVQAGISRMGRAALRLKVAVAVTRHLHLSFARTGAHLLGPLAVARVAAVASTGGVLFVAQMGCQFALQHGAECVAYQPLERVHHIVGGLHSG